MRTIGDAGLREVQGRVVEAGVRRETRRALDREGGMRIFGKGRPGELVLSAGGDPLKDPRRGVGDVNSVAQERGLSVGELKL